MGGTELDGQLTRLCSASGQLQDDNYLRGKQHGDAATLKL